MKKNKLANAYLCALIFIPNNCSYFSAQYKVFSWPKKKVLLLFAIIIIIIIGLAIILLFF